MTHTPGPWKWDGDYRGLASANGQEVLHWEPYEGMWLHHRELNRDDDANLIAAAPELLEALEELSRVYANGDFESEFKPALKRAEAAIAKARGAA